MKTCIMDPWQTFADKFADNCRTQVHGNKCGRMMARVLGKHHASTYVRKLHSPLGAVVQHTLKIASLFREYYVALYNVDSASSPIDVACKQSRIEAYLSSSAILACPPSSRPIWSYLYLRWSCWLQWSPCQTEKAWDLMALQRVTI